MAARVRRAAMKNNMNQKKNSSLSLQSRVGYMCGGAAQTTIVMLINVVLTYF